MRRNRFGFEAVSATLRVLSLACLLLAANSSCRRAPPVRSGDEVYAVAADALLGVVMRGGGTRVEARRSDPAQAFWFRFEHGAAGQHCAPTPELEAALAHVRSIRAGEVLPEREAERRLGGAGAGDWIELEIRDSVQDGDSRAFSARLLPRDGGTKLYAQLPGKRWAFAIDPNVLSLLHAHCPAAK